MAGGGGYLAQLAAALFNSAGLLLLRDTSLATATATATATGTSSSRSKQVLVGTPLSARSALSQYCVHTSSSPRMVGKVVVGEATARQVASFVLGSVAALTLVLLLQSRPASLTRATTQYLFVSGWSSASDHHRRNGTAAGGGGVQAIAGAGGVDHHEANVTKKQPAAAAVSTSTGDLLLPGADHDQEGGDDEFVGLAAAVSRAATEDRTVIITCVNQAWAAPGSLLDLFLESFRIGDGTARLLRHVLIVAMDPTALAQCRSVHPHCYLYTMPGVDFASAKFFLSKEYLELVWSKLKLQRRVLQLGYNFLFTDVDIMWLRDPFKHVTVYADMTISSDVFFGDPDNINNFPNTGFFHVKPSNRTIAMTRIWHEARGRYPGANEQPVFNMIKKELVAGLQLRLRYLDPAFMGGFCNYGKDLGKICTMHANCCVGLGKKLRDLRGVLDDWKNYTRMPNWVKHNARWTVPGACIH